jgi:hypothetical protein
VKWRWKRKKNRRLGVGFSACDRFSPAGPGA